ncbi:hypothetical protein ACQP00_21535 [Dactylosporangium sp. CS-047395]|uniref:hypothetical protein n=1 Tax=Dactylosporangium sp. CS-047395 TaxID=3239936 RepID=UPI003D8C3EEE
MRPRIVAAALAGLLVVACGLLGYCSVRPPDFHDFRVAAVTTAQAAHDALLTADLTGGAVRDGKATRLYATVMLDDSTKSLGSAVKDFAELPPPDATATALRDRLLPLLSEAVARLGDTAADPAHTDGLRALAGRLKVFTDENG